MIEYLIIATAIIAGLMLAAPAIQKKIGTPSSGDTVDPGSLIDCVRKQFDPTTTAQDADVFFGLSSTGPKC